MTINEGRQKRRISKAGSGKESQRQTVRREDAYSRITVTLPTFIVITLRHLVKDANEKHPEWEEEWSLSALLERWLSDNITRNELEKVAVNAPGFKRAAEAWMRWEAQERARRPRMTRLEAFLKANKLKPGKVAREAKVSRQHLLRVRKGAMQPTIPIATRIRYACGRLLKRRLKLSDLFEV
jgi:hypothetical protein